MSMRNPLNGLKIGIVGGSIAGSSLALLLHRQGVNVTLLERSTDLIGRGAGIVLPETLIQQCISLDLFDKDIPRLPATSRSFLVNSDGFKAHGKEIWRQAFEASALNWSDVYLNLRKRIPKEIYHSGEPVHAIRPEQNSYQVATLNGKQYQFDLLIAADGVDSTIRKFIFPAVLPNYVGYVAWRGILSVPTVVAQTLFDKHVPYYVFPHGHILLYRIPSSTYQDDNSQLLNWVLYEDRRNLPLSDLLIDRDGIQHTVSLPPGSLKQEHIQHLRALANEMLPAAITEIIQQTEKPFLQAIFDFQVPQYVKDRICLIGDAATVLRPHSASGTVKSLMDSFSLVKNLTAKEGNDLSSALSAWNELQLQTAQQQVAIARNMGDALVTQTPDWEKMNKEKMEEWWQNIMQGKNWYATCSAYPMWQQPSSSPVATEERQTKTLSKL